jgi:hypothetical protein
LKDAGGQVIVNDIAYYAVAYYAEVRFGVGVLGWGVKYGT